MSMLDFLNCFPPVYSLPKKRKKTDGPVMSMFKSFRDRFVSEITTPCDALPLSSSLRRVNNSSDQVDEWKRLGLLLLFVVLDTTKGLAVAWATLRINDGSSLNLGTKNIVSVGFGLALAMHIEGGKGVRRCLDLSKVLKLFPIAACFGLAQICMLQACQIFNPGSMKIMAQINIPITCFLSWLLLGQPYSTRQWLAITLLFIASISFFNVRMLFFQQPYWAKSQSVKSRDKTIGLGFFVTSIFISCTASIFAERFLKRTCDTPFYIQKTNLVMGELVLSCLVMQLSGQSCSCMFKDMNPRHMLIFIIWALHGWTAGLLVKRCSALVKNIGHVLSAIFTYAVPLILVSGNTHFWPVSMCAAVVLLAILVFATTPGPSRDLDTTGVIHAPKSPFFSSRTTYQELMKKLSCSSGRLIDSIRALKFEALVLSFVCLDALKPFFVSWAHQNKLRRQHFSIQTFILVQTTLSFLVGLILAAGPSLSFAPFQITLHPSWRRRIARSVHLPSVICRLPVSCCLGASKLCLILALGHLDAGTARVFCQSSLPLVALFSAIFFSRRYSSQQWLSLGVVTVSLVAFFHVRKEIELKGLARSDLYSSKFDLPGVLLILGAMSSNIMGSFLAEKFLKQREGHLFEQKVQLVLGEALLNIGILCLQPLVLSEAALSRTPWGQGFFTSFDHRALICVLIWIPAGWTATMIVKEGSSLVKVLSQAAASVLTYVFSIVLAPETLLWPVVLLALTVMLGALTFGLGGTLQSAPTRKESFANLSERMGSSPSLSDVTDATRTDWKIDNAYSRLPKRIQGS